MSGDNVDIGMESEAAAWNRRYREGSHDSQEPDPFLLYAYREFVQPLFPCPGSALDLAGGLGRNAICLAQQGWRVRMMDVSEVGLAKARGNASHCATNIDFEVRDLETFTATDPYDLVLVFFYLQRSLFPQITNSLRPGGLLIYKTYTHLQPAFGKGPTHPMHLLDDDELLHAFSDLKVLYYRETVRDRGIAEFVARKS